MHGETVKFTGMLLLTMHVKHFLDRTHQHTAQ